jgi:tRNA threonylcarbamoyladenosine modification (KEOPS) complex  Pcc1 subunit
MSFLSKIEINGPKKLLEAYRDSILPEKEFKTDRANYDLEIKEKKLIIKINAKDATAFRAVMTSLTGLMAVVYSSWKAKGDE